MDDSNRPKLILLVLFIAVVILGYFLFQRLIASKQQQEIPSITQQVTVSPSPVAPSLPVVINRSPKPLTVASPQALAQGSTTQRLPQTGSEDFLVVIMAASILIGGLALRKYPQ
jgi:LPXTG-motif cell wall-anchored protein